MSPSRHFWENLLILFLALPIIYFLFAFYYSDKTLPNSYFASQDVSSMDSSEIKDAVSGRVDSFLKSRIILQLPGETIEVDPLIFGIQFDEQRTVETILNYGKSGNYVNDFVILSRAPFVKSKFIYLQPSLYRHFPKTYIMLLAAGKISQCRSE